MNSLFKRVNPLYTWEAAASGHTKEVCDATRARIEPQGHVVSIPLKVSCSMHSPEDGRCTKQGQQITDRTEYHTAQVQLLTRPLALRATISSQAAHTWDNEKSNGVV